MINRERPNHRDSESKPSSPDGGLNTYESAFMIYSSSSEENEGRKGTNSDFSSVKLDMTYKSSSETDDESNGL